MNIFISGGCKNGKSHYAQEISKQMSEEQGVPLYYIATMEPTDEEDLARIARHRRERAGWGFETIECAHHIEDVLEKADPKGAFLLDSVTALLANEMFASKEPESDNGLDTGAHIRVAEELVRLAEKTGNMVFVSDFIYAGGYDYDELTKGYMEGLAYIDRALAKVCGQVIEFAYGQKIYYKG